MPYNSITLIRDTRRTKDEILISKVTRITIANVDARVTTSEVAKWKLSWKNCSQKANGIPLGKFGNLRCSNLLQIFLMSVIVFKISLVLFIFMMYGLWAYTNGFDLGILSSTSLGSWIQGSGWSGAGLKFASDSE